MALIDRFMPTYRLREVDRAAVAAATGSSWKAIRSLDLYRLSIVRRLFALRAVPDRLAAFLRGQPYPSTPVSMRIEDFTGPGKGFLVLAEERGREIVIGSVGRFWQPRIDFVPISPDAFAGFAEPGYGKLARPRRRSGLLGWWPESDAVFAPQTSAAPHIRLGTSLARRKVPKPKEEGQWHMQ